jgi:hypothetical protein
MVRGIRRPDKSRLIIDMAMNQPSSKTSAIARKVLAGEKATPEETKSLAAWVLGQNEENQASSETPSIAGRVLAGGKPTREEKENLAASALAGQRSTWWAYAAVSAVVVFAVLVIYLRASG